MRVTMMKLNNPRDTMKLAAETCSFHYLHAMV